MSQRSDELEHLKSWRSKAEDWLEGAEKRVKDKNLSAEDSVKLRLNITATQRRLADLPQVERLVRQGVPLAEVGMPAANEARPKRRERHLRLSLSRWQRKQAEKARAEAQKQQEQLQADIAAGKVDPKALEPDDATEDTAQQRNRQLVIEMASERRDHRELFRRDPSWTRNPGVEALARGFGYSEPDWQRIQARRKRPEATRQTPRAAAEAKTRLKLAQEMAE